MKLYNTLSGRAEPFSPGDDVVKMYVCGITPYDVPHVGHAMKSVAFDVIRRYLEFRGYEVKHVENITDLDDKMIQGAAGLGITTDELAERNTKVYLDQMAALNVLQAHIYPKATEEIPRMQEIIEALSEKGFAYAVDGDVYFRVRENEDYGKLSRRTLDSMRAGSRVEVDEHKEDEMDFVLWKSHKPGEPSWDSPWGPGRPGWHIECSAMALRYLGTPLDIHGGGQDLVFPHHENEIAQTESYADGQPMARFWVHNGLIRMGQDKMSKSLGNFVTVREALQRFSADALRLFFLSSHYRSPLAYTNDGVAAQERAAERLRNAAGGMGTPGEGPPIQAQQFRDRFIDAMDDDLNTPRALAALFDLAHEINRGREQGASVAAAQDTLRELAGVLGLRLEASAEAGRGAFLPLVHLLFDIHAELRASDHRDLAERMRLRSRDLGGDFPELAGVFDSLTVPEEISTGEVAPLLALLIETRDELREARQFGLADQVRSRLSELGYVLEDSAEGTRWKRGTP